MRSMAPIKDPLLSEIEAFLSATKMGASYFGKRATGNSELVTRLRANRRVWPETAAKVRSFMHDNRVRQSGHGNTSSAIQGAGQDQAPVQGAAE